MQVQKELDSFELYSNRVSNANVSGIKMNKTGKRVLHAFLVLFVVALFITSVVAVNIAFDGSVLAASPVYTLNSPEYSSYNSVFSGYKPTVTFSIVNRGGDELIVSIEAMQLKDVLDERGIIIDDSCVVNYPLDTTVYDGMEVVIDSITYEEVQVDSVINYDTKTIELQTIPKGKKKVITNGANGKLTSTYRKKYVNGVFESEELIKQATTLEPITEVVELGVGGSFVGKDGKTYHYSYYLDVQATCYGKADGSGSITATGTLAREGVIAVDPKVIPLGTTVYVKGSYKDIGVCYAEDTGGAIKGNIIDVYMEGTLQQLLQFGRRNMRVYILE